MGLSTQLKQRLIIGGVGIFFLTFAIYFSHSPVFKPIFVCLMIGSASLALFEFYQLAQHKHTRPLTAWGLGCGIAYLIAVYLSTQFVPLLFLPPLILLLALGACFAQFFNQRSNPLINLAITVFGLLYLIFPLSFILKLNYLAPSLTAEDGRLWLAYVLAVTKMTDTGAYFFGKTLGRTKLAPHISPKKTVEGALGGIGMALVTSLLFYYGHLLFFPLSFSLTLWQSIWLGILISLFAQFGDLAESILKRDAGVKDSSHLPGLGGMLDIVDSLIFTIPLVYLLLKMGLVGSVH